MTVKLMTDQALAGKRVLIREDLNVPIKDGVVTSDARIKAALPTIKLVLEAGAKVILMSHLGRPTEGHYEDTFSMKPVAAYLSDLLDCPVNVARDWQAGLESASGSITMLENVRFNSGEKSNDDDLAKAYAALCDVFVMDAFGTAHRAQGL